MKRVLFAVLFIALLGSGAFAEPKMQVGATVGWDMNNSSMDYTLFFIPISVTETIQNLYFGAFFDAIYARAIIDYRMYLSGSSTTAGVTANDPSGSTQSFIDITVLGKYPFDLGGVTIWPALGIKYALALTNKFGSVDQLSQPTADFNDFYISGGAGLDISAGPVIIGLSALFDYNLTPNPSNVAAPSGYTYSGSDFRVGLNVSLPL